MSGYGRLPSRRVYGSRQCISGLAELADGGYDLIVTDINMPKMDGKTFIRKLARAGIAAKTPIVVITSQADDQTTRSLVDAGAALVLAKPISPASVAAAIGTIGEVKESLC